MANLTLSEKYGIAAAVGLLLMVIINHPLVMLGISIIGIVAGFWVVRQGEVRRIAFVGFMGFVVAAVLAVMALVRGG
jgi:hypothetical protein